MSYQDRGDFSQRSQRRNKTFTDQHGRKYHASIEIKTGDPCGIIGALYQCPLPVPSMYLKLSPDPNRPHDLIVDYDRWIADRRAALADWKKRAIAAGTRRYGDEFDPTAPLPADILELFPRPDADPEPVIAARQGNSWILGKTTTPDLRLAKYFAPEVMDPQYHAKNEPDFRDVEDLEAALDLEEEVDPEATGGKRVAVNRGGRPRKNDAKPVMQD